MANRLFGKIAEVWRERVWSKPNAHEERVLRTGYSVAASALLRPRLTSNLPAGDRNAVVAKLMRQSRVRASRVGASKFYNAFAVMRASSKVGLISFGTALPVLGLRGAAAVGLASSAATTLGGYSFLKSEKPRIKDETDAFVKPFPKRLVYFGAPSSQLAVHEAVHAIAMGNPLKARVLQDNFLAMAAQNAYSERAKKDLPEFIFKQDDLDRVGAREDYLFGSIIGHHALQLGESVGSKKAAWDYLWLLSRGVRHENAERAIREVYQRRAKRDAQKAGKKIG